MSTPPYARIVSATILVSAAVLLIGACDLCAGDPCASFALVTRQRWGARPSDGTDYQLLPVPYVIVHHTVTRTCATKSQCARIIASIQAFHMDHLSYDDIGYNFLIGNDGRVYEGTGWHIVGAHTYHYNRNGLGIAFIGDFSDELPTEAAMNAAKELMRCGVRRGELDRHYRMLAGRQLIATDSPGTELYGEIQQWDNWATSP